MRGLFPKAVVILMGLALSACVGLGPDKGKSSASNLVTGGEIEVTSLDPPKATEGKPATKDAKDSSVTAEEEQAVATAPLLPEAPTTKPKPRPATKAAEEASEPSEAVEAPPTPVAADAAPEEAKSPAQIACEKKDSIWAKVGDTGANYCAKRMRDNGKRCTKGTECEGLCLARSGTCAPFDPLFGCNEILQDDGSRVTLCIN